MRLIRTYIIIIIIIINKIRYILWVVALRNASDVTNNGRHLGFYLEMKIRLNQVKTARNGKLVTIATDHH